MKTLEQLGISPAPWKINEYATVLDRYSTIISGQYGPYNWHNARIIAAAPELYEALYDVVAYCESTHLVPSDRFGKVLARAKAALAKAAGESEVEK